MLINSEESEPTADQTEDSQMPNPDEVIDSVDLSTRKSRGSIYLDLQKKRLTYTPMGMLARLTQSKKIQKPSTGAKKINSEYLNSLTPDKLAELKYIFQICDPNNIGEFAYSHLETSI